MAHSGSQYGSMPHSLEAGTFVPKRSHQSKRRARMTISSICCTLLFPWIMFSIVYALFTFKYHYDFPWLSWFVAASLFLSFGCMVVMGFMGFNKATATFSSNWSLYFFVLCLMAVVAGTLLGDINFWTNMQPYYDLETLNQYNMVNTAESKGESMMDAGMIKFAKGSGLDMNLATSFQVLDTYCAVPIVPGFGVSNGVYPPVSWPPQSVFTEVSPSNASNSSNSSSAGNASNSSAPAALPALLSAPLAPAFKTPTTYDFWAVGLNCCPKNTSGHVAFRCGQSSNPNAVQGLRIMDDRQRDYYRLAVQQAEAENKIMAKHPLFFYWSEDARTDMDGYWIYGNKYFKVGVMAYFVLQLFLLIVGQVVASKFEFSS